MLNKNNIPRAILHKYPSIEYAGEEGNFILAKAAKNGSNPGVILNILNLDDPKVQRDKGKIITGMILNVICNSTNVPMYLRYQFYHEYSTSKTCIVFEDQETQIIRAVNHRPKMNARNKYRGLDAETRPYTQSTQNPSDCLNESLLQVMEKKVSTYLQSIEDKKQEVIKKSKTVLTFETVVMFRDFDGTIKNSVQFITNQPQVGNIEEINKKPQENKIGSLKNKGKSSKDIKKTSSQVSETNLCSYQAADDNNYGNVQVGDLGDLEPKKEKETS